MFDTLEVRKFFCCGAVAIVEFRVFRWSDAKRPNRREVLSLPLVKRGLTRSDTGENSTGMRVCRRMGRP